MYKLDRCPSTLGDFGNGYSSQALQTLFDGEAVSPFLSFSFKDGGVALQASESKISVSGVQEKYPAVIENGEIRIARQGERSTHILKPFPLDRSLKDRHQIPANEHLTMQLASQVYGIDTAPNGLCFAKDGHPVFITRRFDILGEEKLLMEDFASVLSNGDPVGGNHFKYSGSYKNIAEGINRVVRASGNELRKLLKIIAFNYLYGNGDAHLKNFSLIMRDGDFCLSPSYDLMNTALHIDDGDFALSGDLDPDMVKSEVWERTGHPCVTDFVLFGERIGLDAVTGIDIMYSFREIPEAALRLIDRSFLSQKTKRSYLRIIRERHARFLRMD